MIKSVISNKLCFNLYIKSILFKIINKMEFKVEDNKAFVKCRMTMDHFYEYEFSEINQYLIKNTPGFKSPLSPETD